MKCFLFTSWFFEWNTLCAASGWCCGVNSLHVWLPGASRPQGGSEPARRGCCLYPDSCKQPKPSLPRIYITNTQPAWVKVHRNQWPKPWWELHALWFNTSGSAANKAEHTQDEVMPLWATCWRQYAKKTHMRLSTVENNIYKTRKELNLAHRA